jgi:transposase
MPSARLSRFTLLPELELEKMSKVSKSRIIFKARKVSKFEVCPKCATKSDRIYDHREVKIQDAPLRGRKITLLIRKRRFECPGCTSVFTEPVPGISKGKRFTQRFKAHVLWACEKFTDLKAVKHHVGCSYGFLCNALYEQLELNRRKTAHEQWPQVIGIDEHSFKKNKVYRHMEFVTMLVDHRNKRTIDMVHGKSGANLKDSLRYIPKRSNVNWVTMDLSQTFRRFSKDFFPRAQIVADKFHVVRLLDNHINKYRKAITGDQRKNPIRKLLLKNEINLDYWKKSIIQKWLSHHPDLREIYFLKQALHRLYRTKGYNKASKAFTKLTDRMGRSKLREVLTLRKTLLSWRSEILNYFKTRLTNARVEGFNNKAKLIKRRAYGYKSFKNYRLRVLNACC